MLTKESLCDICGRKINLEVFKKDMAFQNWLESTGMSLPYPFQPTYYYVKNSDGSNPRFYCSGCIGRK